MADPLHCGTMHLNAKELPKLTSGEKIFKKLHSLLERDEKIEDQLYGDKEILVLFGKLFPELVQSNNIGKTYSQEAHAIWTRNGNVIEIELDGTKKLKQEDKKNVYIGGPAALFAAFIEAKARQGNLEIFGKRSELAYFHNGNRGLSNWKGSASYFHLRDCVPVFYWPDNTGLYLGQIGLKHWLQKKLTPEKYYRNVYNDSDFIMLRTDDRGIWNELDVIPLLAMNLWYMVKDVGLHLTSTWRIMPPLNSNPTQSIAYVTLQHAAMSREVLEYYSGLVDRPLLLGSSEDTRTLHLELIPGEKGEKIFLGIKKYNPKYVSFRQLPKDEIRSRGYNQRVLQALEFPCDGYLPPYLDEELEKEIRKGNGSVNGKKKLTKLLVRPKDDRDLLVSHIVLEDVESKKEEKVAINELFLSLGPSARKIIVKTPDYTLRQHLKDILARLASGSYYEKEDSRVYPPTMKSLLRHAVNDVESLVCRNNILRKMMWASGSSSVLLIKVDLEKVNRDKLAKFRDHVDTINRHYVRLAEKKVVLENGKELVFFATQVAAGALFPSLNVHPETALNAIKSGAMSVYGLDEEGIEYDIVQVRSCARGLTAQNAFRFTAPFANMVQVYGLGGIGMTTIASNGVLLKALMKTRKLLASGAISETEYTQRLTSGDFGDIPDFGKNIFDRNYAQFTDSAAAPMKLPRMIRRKLGVDDSLSAMEYGMIASGAAVTLGCALLLKRHGLRLRAPRKLVQRLAESRLSQQSTLR